MRDISHESCRVAFLYTWLMTARSNLRCVLMSKILQCLILSAMRAQRAAERIPHRTDRGNNSTPTAVYGETRATFSRNRCFGADTSLANNPVTEVWIRNVATYGRRRSASCCGTRAGRRVGRLQGARRRTAVAASNSREDDGPPSFSSSPPPASRLLAAAAFPWCCLASVFSLSLSLFLSLFHVRAHPCGSNIVCQRHFDSCARGPRGPLRFRTSISMRRPWYVSRFAIERARKTRCVRLKPINVPPICNDQNVSIACASCCCERFNERAAILLDQEARNVNHANRIRTIKTWDLYWAS